MAAILSLLMQKSIIVLPDFFVVKRAHAISLSDKLPFPRGLKSRTHIGYCAVNHEVTTTCTNCDEWSHQFRRYNNSPPYVMVDSVNTGAKKRPNSPFKIPWSLLIYRYSKWASVQWSTSKATTAQSVASVCCRWRSTENEPSKDSDGNLAVYSCYSIITSVHTVRNCFYLPVCRRHCRCIKHGPWDVWIISLFWPLHFSSGQRLFVIKDSFTVVSSLVQVTCWQYFPNSKK